MEQSFNSKRIGRHTGESPETILSSGWDFVSGDLPFHFILYANKNVNTITSRQGRFNDCQKLR